MIQRTMTLQIATEFIFEDDPKDASPVVRVFDDKHLYKWWVVADNASFGIPLEVMFHARQFLYDNHPELGPQPTEEELRKKRPGQVASSPSTQR